MSTHELKLWVKDRSYARKEKVVRVRGKGGFVRAKPGDTIVWSLKDSGDTRRYSVRFYGVDDEDQKNELWPFSWPPDPVTEALRFVPVDIDKPFTATLGSAGTFKYSVDTNDGKVEPLDPMIIVRDALSATIRRPLLVSAALGAAVGAMVAALILTRR